MGMGRPSRAVVATVAMMTALMVTGVGAASADTADDNAVSACKEAVSSAASNFAPLSTAQQALVDGATTSCESITAATASTQGTTILTPLTTALGRAASTAKTSSSSSGSSDSTSSTDTTSSDTSTSSSNAVGTTTSNKLNCDDFPTPADAQAELLRDPSDPNNLDGDNDGQACDDGTGGATTNATYTGYPSGGVASGDGSTGGVDLGGLVLLAMLGLTVLAGATRVAVDRGARKAA